MISGVSPLLLVVLALVSFVGGVVVATLGPGGIFVIAALYAGTSLSNAEIAGTSSATFTAGALLGSAVYARSDDVDWSVALAVGITGAIGTYAGVQFNAGLSRQLFGAILSALLVAVGVAIVYGQVRGYHPAFGVDTDAWSGLAVLGVVGLAIGFFGGLLGIGGAALSVPALVVVGVPMVVSVAVTQVVVIFVTVFTTVNYLLLGAVVLPVAAVTGTSYLAGVVVGWRVAHRIDADRLELALGIALFGLAAFILVQ